MIMMKNITFISIFLLGFFQNLTAQCTTIATGFGNNSSSVMYNVLGTVEVVLNSNNSVTVNLFSNFSTASGPDVRIFLVDRGDLSNAQLKIPTNFLSLTKLEMGFSPASGAASFTKNIPAGMNISNFNTVYFFCQSFSQFWDYSAITAFTPANCSVLKTAFFENQDLQIFPNPANNLINIQLKSVISHNISIYNSIGSLVFEQKNQLLIDPKMYNISHLSPGIYFLKITDNENGVYKKRFVKN